MCVPRQYGDAAGCVWLERFSVSLVPISPPPPPPQSRGAAGPFIFVRGGSFLERSVNWSLLSRYLG